MKYYVIIRDDKLSRSAQFTVEPCSEKMTVRDVRDAFLEIVSDLMYQQRSDGFQPIFTISEASRIRKKEYYDRKNTAKPA